MKTLYKIAVGAAMFAVSLVALHHAIWYSYSLADYAFHITIICIATGVTIVAVES